MAQRIDRQQLAQHPVFQEALSSPDPEQRALVKGFSDFLDSYQKDVPKGLVNDPRPKLMARPELAPGFEYVAVYVPQLKVGDRTVALTEVIPNEVAKTATGAGHVLTAGAALALVPETVPTLTVIEGGVATAAEVAVPVGLDAVALGAVLSNPFNYEVNKLIRPVVRHEYPLLIHYPVKTERPPKPGLPDFIRKVLEEYLQSIGEEAITDAHEAEGFRELLKKYGLREFWVADEDLVQPSTGSIGVDTFQRNVQPVASAVASGPKSPSSTDALIKKIRDHIDGKDNAGLFRLGPEIAPVFSQLPEGLGRDLLAWTFDHSIYEIFESTESEQLCRSWLDIGNLEQWDAQIGMAYQRGLSEVALWAMSHKLAILNAYFLNSIQFLESLQPAAHLAFSLGKYDEAVQHIQAALKTVEEFSHDEKAVTSWVIADLTALWGKILEDNQDPNAASLLKTAYDLFERLPEDQKRKVITDMKGVFVSLPRDSNPKPDHNFFETVLKIPSQQPASIRYDMWAMYELGLLDLREGFLVPAIKHFENALGLADRYEREFLHEVKEPSHRVWMLSYRPRLYVVISTANAILAARDGLPQARPRLNPAVELFVAQPMPGYVERLLDDLLAIASHYRDTGRGVEESVVQSVVTTLLRVLPNRLPDVYVPMAKKYVIIDRDAPRN